MKNIDFIKTKLLELGCNDSEVFECLENIDAQIRLLSDIQVCLCNPDLYLIYKHTDPYGKVYIGITKNLPNSRWNEGGGYEKQRKFYKAIQKYGWIHFKHEIIAAALSEYDAKKLENTFIMQHRALEEDFGYNSHLNLIIDDNKSADLNGLMSDSTSNFDDLFQATISQENSVVDNIKKQSNDCCTDDVQDDLAIFPDYLRLKLKVVGIDSLETLTNYTMKELISLPRIGVKSANYINLILRNHSLNLLPEPVQIVPEPAPKVKEISTIFKPIEIDAIFNWFKSTQESLVCVYMVCEQALGYTRKPNLRISNELHRIIRTEITDWKLHPNKNGRTRCGKFGVQICYVRDNFEY